MGGHGLTVGGFHCKVMGDGIPDINVFVFVYLFSLSHFCFSHMNLFAFVFFFPPFLPVPRSMCDPSFPEQDRTCAPCIGSDKF